MTTQNKAPSQSTQTATGMVEAIVSRQGAAIEVVEIKIPPCVRQQLSVGVRTIEDCPRKIEPPVPRSRK
jgi:hypothetical protein